MKEELDYSEFLKMLTYTDSAEEAANANVKAKFVLSLRDWFYRCIEIDAKTGEPLNDDLTHFLDKLAKSENAKNDNGNEKNVCDWLFKILSYAEKSILYIFDSPKKEILRFHEQIPVYKAKEIDTTGIIDISRRPGRSVREKLAYKPSVIAVKRQQSIDTLENRLFKKFIKKCVVILEERIEYYDEEKLKLEDEDSSLSVLYSKLCRWLKSDEAEEIGEWQNLPPNNILLCDKNYKKIWAAWRGLASLEDLIKKDFKNLDQHIAVCIFWKTAALLQKKNCLLKQQPLSFNYEEFQVRTPCYLSDDNSDEKYAVISTDDFIFSIKNNVIFWQQVNKVPNKTSHTHLIKIGFDFFEIDGKPYKENLTSLDAVIKVSEKLTKSIYKEWNGEYRTLPANYKETQAYTVFDFSEKPYLSISNTSFDAASKETVDHYPKQLLRQFWKKNGSSESINLDCEVSPALYKNHLNDFDINEISADEILYESIELLDDSLTEHKIEAEYNFMNSIKDYYNTNSLYYILPDYLEDFALGLIRSTANIVFTDSNPVPASVGAVFDFQNSADFTACSLKENDFVFVIEKKSFSGNKTILSITPLCAKTKYKKDDNANVVELKSFKEIPGGIRWEHHPSLIVSDYEPSKIMEYIKDAAGKTEGLLPSSSIYIISNQQSIKSARLVLPKSNWHFISAPFNSAKGVASYVKLQQLVRDIPMWSEHLPNLQMTVIVDGKRKFINLTNGKTVLPIRNQAQDLNISEVFTLNKNVREFHFRLIRGIGENIPALKYEACLTNPAFPLKNNTKCKLKMYYSYGQAHPFDLKFVPVTSSNFVQAAVEWKKIDESKFPVPNFPQVRTWKEYVNWKDSISHEIRSLIEWEEKNFDKIFSLEKFYRYEFNDLDRYTIELPELPEYTKDKDGLYFTLDFCNKEKEWVSIKIYKKILEDSLKQTVYPGVKFSFSVNKNKFELDNDGRKIFRSYGITAGKAVNTKLIVSLSRSLRFPTMQIWNIRNSVLKDESIPEEFKCKTVQAIKTLDFLLNNENVKKQSALWNELFLFACVMHSDALDIVSSFMNEKLLHPDFNCEKWRDTERNCFQFGYFIGDANTEIQKKVFEWALDFTDASDYSLCSFKLQVLTIALWRNEYLLHTIPCEKMKFLLNEVINAIQHEYEDLKDVTLSNRLLNPLRSHLELLCALVRSRYFDKDFQELFSPFNPEIQKIISLVEEIYIWIKNKGKSIYTRQIKFTIQDSENGNGFLDYLLLWIDGQNSTEMPKIESATDEDSGDTAEEAPDEE